jgi:chromosome segregation ATPase
MSSKGSVKRSEQSLKRRAEYDRNYRKRKKEKCEEDAAHISLLQLQLQRLEEIMAIYESENERLKTENKQLREEIEQMREDLKGVEREVCEASEVITKLHHHSSHLYLENKWIKTNLNKADIVVNNFNELLSDLPRCHSSIALPLINRLTQHLPPKDACEMFGISRWRLFVY